MEIAANFVGLNCRLFWRPFDSDGTIEFEYKKTENEFLIKKDFDLRFKCTWLRLGKLIFIF